LVPTKRLSIELILIVPQRAENRPKKGPFLRKKSTKIDKNREKTQKIDVKFGVDLLIPE
jgi:hypothetical protein